MIVKVLLEKLCHLDFIKRAGLLGAGGGYLVHFIVGDVLGAAVLGDVLAAVLAAVFRRLSLFTCVQYVQ